jgi:ABC-type nitrate/sulfonate/bicarbonate transport system ATPase subunit
MRLPSLVRHRLIHAHEGRYAENITGSPGLQPVPAILPPGAGRGTTSGAVGAGSSAKPDGDGLKPWATSDVRRDATTDAPVDSTSGPRNVLAGPVNAPSKLSAERISHAFARGGERLLVLNDVSLCASAGEFVTLIGPSGCGKSTLFAAMAGLLSPAAGRVCFAGRDITGQIGPVAYMPQKDLLLPWKTVLDNTIIGLELRGMRRRHARAEAETWFPRFGLAGFERAYPPALSGGMRQRAALLRTFLTGRDILLLDEPFGALDALTRVAMQQWLIGIWASSAKTVVLISHDIDEAIFLSDRVYVMSPRPGRIMRVIDVPFGRPRPYQQTVTAARFAALKGELLELLAGSLRENV